ncbi:MAG TPA: cytochrome c3 family protein, partial [Pyrinomonadaceae bacterium]|nr:cytochrome c3 family protein [Pyrinomonadaceae bacterium]
MTSRTTTNACRYKAVALVTFVAVASLAFIFPRPGATAAAVRDAAKPQRRAGTARRKSPPNRSAKTPRRRSLDFSHRVAAHQRQACDSCHKFPSSNWKEVRAEQEAFPDITQYPEHASCLNCHRQQFFAREFPRPSICSVCHVAVTPRDQTRYPFPNPRAAFDASAKGRASVSDFRINFPHDKHLELFSRSRPQDGDASPAGFMRVSFQPESVSANQESDPKSCATRHQTYQPQNESAEEFVTSPPKDLPEGAFWLKKGTFKTVPHDHAACFTCHSVEGGLSPAPSDCALCHRLSP